MTELPGEDFVEPGQKWEVDFFHPEDAPGVVRLFQMVYGEGYPVKTFTDPERLIEESAAGLILSSVARTPKGDIVGHTALYRIAPYHGICEAGASLVASNYRSGMLTFRLFEHSATAGVPRLGLDAFFAELVCNHVLSQRLSGKFGLTPCAFEVDLMPAEAYTKEESASGRVATVLAFKIRTAKPQTIYLPEACEEMVRFVYDGIARECRFTLSSEELPAKVETRIETRFFDFAKVARFTVHDAGEDFATVIEGEEKAAALKGMIVCQVWLKLSWPWVGRAVDLLRSRGYFTGGVLPRWFDGDGLLMQKVTGTPNWEGIHVYGERAAKILSHVRAGWAETQTADRG